MRVRDLTVASPPTWTVEEVAGGHVMRDANRDVGPVYGTVRIGSAQEEAACADVTITSSPVMPTGLCIAQGGFQPQIFLSTITLPQLITDR